jgi:putative transposase
MFGGEQICRVLSNSAEWVARFNLQRLHFATATIRPVEHEANHYPRHQSQPAAGPNP